MRILVTGANGQLGHCIYDIVKCIFITGSLNNEYHFLNHNDFDITDKTSIYNFMYTHFIPDCIINCAAYTNVEKAETDKYGAFMVNSFGVKNLVDICTEFNIVLIHISTDYVYDDNVLYTVQENDKINPSNIYGQSKRDGELNIINSKLTDWFIFRTSWLYSEYGSNFFTKIINQHNAGKKIFAATDEYGSPTYAKKLAEMIVNMIEESSYDNLSCSYNFKLPYGIYNFSGLGGTNRYEFASDIIYGLRPSLRYQFDVVSKITQDEGNKLWNLCAKRPKHVILDNTKINSYLTRYNNWLSDLGECLNNYDELTKIK